MNVAVPPQSPHLRLYDCAKSAIIKNFAFLYATVCYMLLSFMIFKQNPESNFTFIGCQMPKVCDMYCDSGMDTDKWCDAQDGFEAQVQEKGIQADMVCCMQHLQASWLFSRTVEYDMLSCFENEERAKKLLNNVSSLLKPRGYFFGITLDSSTIWTKYQKNVEASHNKGLKTVPNSIRSENYTITFEVEEEKLPLCNKYSNYCDIYLYTLYLNVTLVSRWYDTILGGITRIRLGQLLITRPNKPSPFSRTAQPNSTGARPLALRAHWPAPPA
ncbi:hypothetical protein ACJX0J_042344, partial [Zea mays]